MKQRITKRIEKLEAIAGVNEEELIITVRFVGSDNERKRIITGGLRMIPGQPREELPASFFTEEGDHETTNNQKT